MYSEGILFRHNFLLMFFSANILTQQHQGKKKDTDNKQGAGFMIHRGYDNASSLLPCLQHCQPTIWANIVIYIQQYISETRLDSEAGNCLSFSSFLSLFGIMPLNFFKDRFKAVVIQNLVTLDVKCLPLPLLIYCMGHTYCYIAHCCEKEKGFAY